ncbi:MAG: aldehyde dehydrogenase family protein [Magnetovibrionaceae bacterium]
MTDTLFTISPIDSSIYVERKFATDDEIFAALEAAREAQPVWSSLSFAERAHLVGQAIDLLEDRRERIAEEITRQIGRPLAAAREEVDDSVRMARHLIELGRGALDPVVVNDSAEDKRSIRRVPHGLVFVISPWTYPLESALTWIVPALLAGNSVALRISNQAPLTAERLMEAFGDVGLPYGTFRVLHLDQERTLDVMRSSDVDFVCYAGNSAVAARVERALAGRFTGSILQLGGKDAAYVREDADLESAVRAIVKGVFINGGQARGALERLYIAKPLFDDFVEAFRAEVHETIILGDPFAPQTTLGPLGRMNVVEGVHNQTDEAVARGARPLIDISAYEEAMALGSRYVGPQAFVQVDHSMQLMTEVSFGPLCGIMPVQDDDEAVALMNDSVYAHAAAIFTADEARAFDLAGGLVVGTVYQNHCCVTDPALPWTGVKSSGRGTGLSTIAYEQLTRPKALSFRPFKG